MIKKYFLIILLPLTFFSCAKSGLNANDSLSSSKSGSFSNITDSNPTNDTLDSVAPTPLAIDSIDMKSYVDDSKQKLGFNNALAFDFDKNSGEFILLLPLPSGFLFTPTGQFSKYPDITFGPYFDANGKAKLSVRIPVKYVIKGLAFIPASRLPNGDPLPAMPAGQSELPSLALSFPLNGNTQMTLYIGVNALGFYVTLPAKAALPIPVNITVPLKNKDKSKTFGYLTYVNAKNGHNPGLFLSTGVPAQFARIIEDHFNLN